MAARTATTRTYVWAVAVPEDSEFCAAVMSPESVVTAPFRPLVVARGLVADVIADSIELTAVDRPLDVARGLVAVVMSAASVLTADVTSEAFATPVVAEVSCEVMVLVALEMAVCRVLTALFTLAEVASPRPLMYVSSELTALVTLVVIAVWADVMSPAIAVWADVMSPDSVVTALLTSVVLARLRPLMYVSSAVCELVMSPEIVLVALVMSLDSVVTALFTCVLRAVNCIVMF